MTENKRLITTDAFWHFYPYKNSETFIDRVHKNWLNLEAGKITGSDSGAALLYHHFKTKHHDISVFTAWLIFCLKRPWEQMTLETLNDFIDINIKEWRCSLSDCLFKNEISNIFIKAFGNKAPDLPDLQAIRKLMIKKEFIKKALWLPFSTNPKFTLFGKIFESKDVKDILKTLEYISLKKYVKKRDLMRHFRFRKNQCDSLLRRPIVRDAIEVKKYPCRTVWITYKGPENL